jgi:hypothetical protein
LDDSFLDLLPIQLTGAGFYRALQAILLVDRQPQLARQRHHVSVGIVRKNDGGIAVIVDFPLALLPASVTPALLVHDAHQLALALGSICVSLIRTVELSFVITNQRRKPSVGPFEP